MCHDIGIATVVIVLECVPIDLLVVPLGAIVCPITNRNMRRIVVTHYSLVLSGRIRNHKLCFTFSTVLERRAGFVGKGLNLVVR